MKSLALIALMIPQLSGIKGSGIFNTPARIIATEGQKALVSAGWEDGVDTTPLAAQLQPLIDAETMEDQQQALDIALKALDDGLDDIREGRLPVWHQSRRQDMNDLLNEVSATLLAHRDHFSMTSQDARKLVNDASTLSTMGYEIPGYKGEFDVLHDYVSRLMESDFFLREKLIDRSLSLIARFTSPARIAA